MSQITLTSDEMKFVRATLSLSDDHPITFEDIEAALNKTVEATLIGQTEEEWDTAIHLFSFQTNEGNTNPLLSLLRKLHEAGTFGKAGMGSIAVVEETSLASSNIPTLEEEPLEKETSHSISPFRSRLGCLTLFGIAGASTYYLGLGPTGILAIVTGVTSLMLKSATTKPERILAGPGDLAGQFLDVYCELWEEFRIKNFLDLYRAKNNQEFIHQVQKMVGIYFEYILLELDRNKKDIKNIVAIEKGIQTSVSNLKKIVQEMYVFLIWSEKSGSEINEQLLYKFIDFIFVQPTNKKLLKKIKDYEVSYNKKITLEQKFEALLETLEKEVREAITELNQVQPLPPATELIEKNLKQIEKICSRLRYWDSFRLNAFKLFIRYPDETEEDFVENQKRIEKALITLDPLLKKRGLENYRDDVWKNGFENAAAGLRTGYLATRAFEAMIFGYSMTFLPLHLDALHHETPNKIPTGFRPFDFSKDPAEILRFQKDVTALAFEMEPSLTFEELEQLVLEETIFDLILDKDPCSPKNEDAKEIYEDENHKKHVPLTLKCGLQWKSLLAQSVLDEATITEAAKINLACFYGVESSKINLKFKNNFDPTPTDSPKKPGLYPVPGAGSNVFALKPKPRPKPMGPKNK